MEEWKEAAAASEAPAEVERKICCYLTGGKDSPLTNDILDIARTYPGKDTLYIKDTGSGAIYRSGVKLDARLARAEMVGLLGENNVRIA